MYLPRHFEETDPSRLTALISRHPLGTWVSVVDGSPQIQHVPFLFDARRGASGTLLGHVARANPAWRTPGPGVVVFQGPEGYVSPSWYASKAVDGKVVPTWNYAVVHAHGHARAIEDRDALREIVSRLTVAHESTRPAPWAVDDAPADYLDRMLSAIVGIEFEIERLEGKFKLSQNRPAEDRAAVRDGVRARADGALADSMDDVEPPATA